MQAASTLQPISGTIREASREREAPTTMGLVELMLKDPDRLDMMTRDEARVPELIPRFLAIALAGFATFGMAATVILNLAGDVPSWVPPARWSDATVVSLTLAYVLGLVGALGVCLPSFYFYGLLSGVKLSMLQATAQATKSQAVGAVALVGVLPLYVAVALGLVVFGAPALWMRAAIGLGLFLPFLAGLWGLRSLFVGFTGLADTLPPCRQETRACFLRRLTLAWAGCYSAVTPVMIFWLWSHLAG